MCYISEQIISTALDVKLNLTHYLGQIMFGIHIKMLLSTLTTVFTYWLFGNVVVLYIYLGFVTLDLALGLTFAAMTRKFSRRKLYGFAAKVLGVLIFITVVGLLAHALFQVVGFSIGIVNWFLFLFIVAEFASVVEKLNLLGLLKHYRFVTVGVYALRRFASKKFCDMLEVPEMAEVMEEALGPNVKIVRLRAGDTDDRGARMRTEFRTGDDNENHSD